MITVKKGKETKKVQDPKYYIMAGWKVVEEDGKSDKKKKATA